MIYDKQHYLDIFKVTEPQLQNLVAEGLRRGGDYSDLYFENTTFGQLMLHDEDLTSGGSHVDFGVGIRVLKGEKTGYAYSENTTMPDMLAAARAASTIAQGSTSEASATELIKAARDRASTYVVSESNGGRPVRKLFNGEPNPAADRYPVQKHWRTTPMQEHLPFLLKLQEAIKAKDSRIVKIIALVTFQVSDYLMFNSFGELKYETRPLASVGVTVVFMQDGIVENKSVSRSYRTGVEMLSDKLIEEIAIQAVKGIDDRFAARKPKGGKMNVVMGAGASGILLHEAMGHAFEADFNRKGQSIFSGKLGCKVCDEHINIIDDGTIHGNRGALDFDDEGVPGQRTCMVENGILTSYLHDRISAKYFNVSPTGNGRRESFRYNPIPRMRATYMESGNVEKDDIIASVKKGIYVDEFSNGQVKIGEGDFTFYVKSGYLIENGHFTQPVKDINIIGNGPEALADIIAVGNDLKIDDSTWTCGKEQSVPVSCGIPTVLVKSLTVGGE